MTDESVCRGLHKATRELRDRWVSMTTNARHVNKSVRKASVPQTGDRTASVDDQRDDRLSRDVVLWDDDDKEIGSLHWVPYVHFGV